MKPTFLAIVNGYGLIDGKQKYKFKLPGEWNIGDLERLFIAACIDHGFNEGMDDEGFINKIVLEATKHIIKGEKESPDNDVNDPSKKLTQPQILVELANQHCEYFKDQYGAAHALVTFDRDSMDAHDEVLPIERNGKFKKLLSKWYYSHTNGEIVGKDAISNACQLLAGIAVFDRQTIELHLRVAWSQKDKELIYDLTNDSFEYVILNGKSWDITRRPKILFKRFNQRSQVRPSREYPKDIMEKYLNLNQLLDPQQRLLTAVWTISCFIPDIPHTIDIVHGEKGAAKTTYCRLQKRLIDPDMVELLTIPKDKNEFVQQLYHTYLPVYDNAKTIPYWFSDEVCKAITGVGNMKRALYTDDDDVVYSYMRCIMVNGINNVLTEPDALDRSIMTELPRIKGNMRREEAQVQAEFEAMRSHLLGFIFDTLVKAITIKPEVKLEELPRMADFTIWGEAIARAMGYKPMEFYNCYRANIGIQNVEAIESSPLAQSIHRFMSNKTAWEGSATEFKEELETIAIDNKLVSTKTVKEGDNLRHIIDDPKWPKAANTLSRKLKPLLSNLRDGMGIEITIARDADNLAFVKVEKKPPISPISPPTENHAQIGSDKPGDILSYGDNTSGADQVSPAELAQNHAQILQTGDTGGSGDIISNSRERFSCLKCDYTTNHAQEFKDHAAEHREG